MLSELAKLTPHGAAIAAVSVMTRQPQKRAKNPAMRLKGLNSV
jgi:hypothetical protein